MRGARVAKARSDTHGIGIPQPLAPPLASACPAQEHRPTEKGRQNPNPTRRRRASATSPDLLPRLPCPARSSRGSRGAILKDARCFKGAAPQGAGGFGCAAPQGAESPRGRSPRLRGSEGQQPTKEIQLVNQRGCRNVPIIKISLLHGYPCNRHIPIIRDNPMIRISP